MVEISVLHYVWMLFSLHFKSGCLQAISVVLKQGSSPCLLKVYVGGHTNGVYLSGSCDWGTTVASWRTTCRLHVGSLKVSFIFKVSVRTETFLSWTATVNTELGSHWTGWTCGPKQCNSPILTIFQALMQPYQLGKHWGGLSQTPFQSKGIFVPLPLVLENCLGLGCKATSKAFV